MILRALAIDEKYLDNHDPHISRDLSNLAQVLWKTKRLSQALRLVRRALVIHEQNFGGDDPGLASGLCDFAGLLTEAGHFSQSGASAPPSAQDTEENLGHEHPDVAISLAWLGRLLRNTDRLTEAESVLTRAVTILLKATKASGHSHPHPQHICVSSS